MSVVYKFLHTTAVIVGAGIGFYSFNYMYYAPKAAPES